MRKIKTLDNKQLQMIKIKKLKILIVKKKGMYQEKKDVKK